MSPANDTRLEEVHEFSAREIDVLARMEHARWNADRFLAGWKLGEKNSAKKTTPYLVDWRNLPEEIQEYDRQPVRNIPGLLAMIGQRIFRQPVEN
jgi:hypothetical protein